MLAPGRVHFFDVSHTRTKLRSNARTEMPTQIREHFRNTKYPIAKFPGNSAASLKNARADKLPLFQAQQGGLSAGACAKAAPFVKIRAPTRSLAVLQGT
jgi:hypothetical protein